MVCWLVGCLVVNKAVFPCNISSQQSNFKNVIITYRNLKLTTVRSVASSAIFVRNGVVQTTLTTHAVRTCGNIF